MRIGLIGAGKVGTTLGKYFVSASRQMDNSDTLKTNPNDRRMICVAFNPDMLDRIALPPCHVMMQFYTREIEPGKYGLSCMWTQRSVDVCCGLPFNIAQYAVLCHLVAQCIGAQPGQFTFITNDAHIYENQIDGIKEQIRRRDEKIAKDGKLYDAPKLWINPEIKDFFKFDSSKELKDIKLENYEHQGKISMKVTA